MPRGIKSFLPGSVLSQLVPSTRTGHVLVLLPQPYLPKRCWCFCAGFSPGRKAYSCFQVPPDEMRASSSKKRLPCDRWSLRCPAGQPLRNSHLPRQPPGGLLWPGLHGGECPISTCGRGTFPRTTLAMGQSFRKCYLSPLNSLQGFQNLASRINEFGGQHKRVRSPRIQPWGFCLEEKV